MTPLWSIKCISCCVGQKTFEWNNQLSNFNYLWQNVVIWVKSRLAIYNWVKLIWRSILIVNAVMPEPGGPGGPLAPPIFGRSVNPIPTREGRLSPPITTGTPIVFHLRASLLSIFEHECPDHKTCLTYAVGNYKSFMKKEILMWRLQI